MRELYQIREKLAMVALWKLGRSNDVAMQKNITVYKGQVFFFYKSLIAYFPCLLIIT